MKKTLSMSLGALLLTLCILLTGCTGFGGGTAPSDTTDPKGTSAGTQSGKGGDTNVFFNAAGLSASEFYEAAKQYGYTGTFMEFVAECLKLDGETNDANLASALLSSVSVYCTFNRTAYKYTIFGQKQAYDEEYSSAGSGVIYRLSSDRRSAYILTNYLVVYDVDSKTENGISDKIQLFLYGNELMSGSISATYVGGSMTYDIAVLKVEDSDILQNSDACAAVFADSNRISVGQTAIAVGNPEASGISATRGVVSVDSDRITMQTVDEKDTVTMRVIRVDTAINSGNSGGGLFNDRGEVIGIVNAKVKASGTENIAYAIPSNIASYVADGILEGAQDGSSGVSKCMLGVTVEVSSSSARLDKETGKTQIVEEIKVNKVEEGSLAAEYLQAGDILESVTIGGKEQALTRSFILVDLMLTCRVGTEMKLTVVRDGVRMTFSFTLTEQSLTIIS